MRGKDVIIAVFSICSGTNWLCGGPRYLNDMSSGFRSCQDSSLKSLTVHRDCQCKWSLCIKNAPDMIDSSDRQICIEYIFCGRHSIKGRIDSLIISHMPRSLHFWVELPFVNFCDKSSPGTVSYILFLGFFQMELNFQCTIVVNKEILPFLTTLFSTL